MRDDNVGVGIEGKVNGSVVVVGNLNEWDGFVLVYEDGVVDKRCYGFDVVGSVFLVNLYYIKFEGSYVMYEWN